MTTAASMALMDAGVEMVDMVVACRVVWGLLVGGGVVVSHTWLRPYAYARLVCMHPNTQTNTHPNKHTSKHTYNQTHIQTNKYTLRLVLVRHCCLIPALWKMPRKMHTWTLPYCLLATWYERGGDLV